MTRGCNNKESFSYKVGCAPMFIRPNGPNRGLTRISTSLNNGLKIGAETFPFKPSPFVGDIMSYFPQSSG
jgi:hypothetical protein